MARLALLDHGVKPKADFWYVTISVLQTGTTQFPATEPSSLQSSGGSVYASLEVGIYGNADYEWTTGTGTVTVSSNWKRGTVDVVLQPASATPKAIGTESIVGSWNCS